MMEEHEKVTNDRLARIETSLDYVTQLLEEERGNTEKIYVRLNGAEKEASEAYKMALENKKKLHEYKESQKNERRWIVGITVSILAILLPLVMSYLDKIIF